MLGLFGCLALFGCALWSLFKAHRALFEAFSHLVVMVDLVEQRVTDLERVAYGLPTALEEEKQAGCLKARLISSRSRKPPKRL